MRYINSLLLTITITITLLDCLNGTCNIVMTVSQPLSPVCYYYQELSV